MPKPKVDTTRPITRWQTRYGQWIYPCAGGCGNVTVRPSVTKMRSWLCDRCARESEKT